MAEMPFHGGIVIATGSRLFQLQKRLPSLFWKNMKLGYTREKSFLSLIPEVRDYWSLDASLIQTQKSGFKL